MVLAGTEVKSLREGKASFADSFCLFDQNELWIRNLHIAEYRLGTANNHLAVRDRKLLMRRTELRRIEGRMREKGYSLIPLRIFFAGKGYAKLELGLGKGKKLFDKRETQQKRDIDREIKRFLK
jgi:SsrA-binding protein